MVFPHVGGNQPYLDGLACDCLLMWMEACRCRAAVYYWAHHSSEIELSEFPRPHRPGLRSKHLFLKSGRSLDLKTA